MYLMRTLKVTKNQGFYKKFTFSREEELAQKHKQDVDLILTFT